MIPVSSAKASKMVILSNTLTNKKVVFVQETYIHNTIIIMQFIYICVTAMKNRYIM